MSSFQEGKIRVLIIDGHEAVRRALQIRLGVAGHLDVVGAVAEPAAAMPEMRTLKPQVIIFGLRNGTDEDLFQTSSAVREMARQSCVVITLAPYADAVEREVLLAAGAKRYLLKHIDSDRLIQEIEAASVLGATIETGPRA